MVTRRFIGQFSMTDPRSVFFLKSLGKVTIWCQIIWVQLTLFPWTSQVFQRSQWYFPVRVHVLIDVLEQLPVSAHFTPERYDDIRYLDHKTKWIGFRGY